MPIEQPASYRKDGADSGFSVQANNQFSAKLAVAIRQTFADYQNRDSSDNRSAQVHMGPSEIGTPCDRRVALHLVGQQPVNEGGDGFAAWLGTQGHRGMADIYEWASGNSGRYAVETPLTFPSEIVPRGTGDLLDRRWRTFVDWKFMGHWSLKKLREAGPSVTYEKQIQTYAYGAVQRGEKVEKVAIVGMPRQGSSLDEMFVWSADYDESVALSAFARVQAIADRIGDGATPADFDVTKDCTYCPYHMAKATDLSVGCNGKA